MKVKTKKRICITIGFVSFFMVLVFVDCMELGTVNLAKGVALSVTAMTVGTAMLWKAGVLKA